jgi:hypothetical protein
MRSSANVFLSIIFLVIHQSKNARVGHGVSLLRWRSGGVKHPHDTPPYPFMPSPTFANSSGSNTGTATSCGAPSTQTSGAMPADGQFSWNPGMMSKGS